MQPCAHGEIVVIGSPPSRGAWIEIENNDRVKDYTIKSPPSRGAWIEIRRHRAGGDLRRVAPLAGGVD